VNPHEISQTIDGLKLQTLWPHEEDIAHDAKRALELINELLERNRALAVMIDRMTSKDGWQIMIDFQLDQFKVRKAFKTVQMQLDDLVKEYS